MIDFRYHIVSLVSVFLALAVGIVLGAGPLNTPLGNTLTSQVESLRQDRDTTRKQLELAQSEVNARNLYIQAAGNDIVADSLTGLKVAVVTLPYADENDIKLAIENLKKAGAKVTAEANVVSKWPVANKRPFRTSLSSQLLQYLTDKPADDASIDTIFGYALRQILTANSEDNSLLSNLLTDSSNPMVTYTQQVSEPADSIVVIGNKNFENKALITGKETKISEENFDSMFSFDVDFSMALMLAPKGGVIFSDDVNTSDFLNAVRAKANDKISTVDSVGTIMGSTSLPLAVANSANGVHGNYGLAKDVTAVIPPKAKVNIEQAQE